MKEYNEKRTIVVNLFAGPGAGKSTGATYVFSKLKMAGVEAEYVSEYAKDKIWEKNDEIFKCQLYITAKQTWKIQRACKVDVVITDSPILLGAIYNNTEPKSFNSFVLEKFNTFNNVNYFINRVKPYDEVGRFQTKEQAEEIDNNLQQYLKNNGVPFIETTGDEEGYNKIVEDILKLLNEKN